MALDKEIFNGKPLSDLFSEIHDNYSNTRTLVKGLIGELKPLIENIGDATLIVPMIKEYMEIGVKNDEHLIKLATIVQRLESAASRGEGVDGCLAARRRQLGDRRRRQLGDRVRLAGYSSPAGRQQVRSGGACLADFFPDHVRLGLSAHAQGHADSGQGHARALLCGSDGLA